MGCSPIKVVRELGSERRETVRSLSTAKLRVLDVFTLVREDQVKFVTDVPVVFF